MGEPAYLEHVRGVVRRWDHLGVERVDERALLVGRVPHVAPQAWLHKVSAPASTAAINALRERLPAGLPAEYLELLRHANGLDLFSNRFCIYGIRSSYARGGDARWQPFDVRTPNTLERVPGAPADHFFIGIYPQYADPIALVGDTGTVIRCSRDDPRPKRSWPSLADLLVSEADRLAAGCDERGVLHLAEI